MQNSLNNLFTFLLFLFYTTTLVAQNISGTVYDADLKETLIGASVVVKGTTNGTVTDFDGAFEINPKGEYPVTLVVSYVGYEEKEVVVPEATNGLRVELGSGAVTVQEVVVKGQRISDKQKAAPLTVESLDVLAIKETTSDNFYDGLGNLKGVDLTAASLGFKVINTRGFNSTSPVRSLQIIDGVDNQAPGLNFSLGNFLGAPELDVRKVDIIQGASSSFYGPNAFNGVIAMETKNPFYTEGLSAQVKAGERNLLNTELRWADSFKNKDGKKHIAYKFTASYLRADDWVADNTDAVDGTPTPTGNPGGWDKVNTYGDEYDIFGDFTQSTSNRFNENAGLITIHGQGYDEIDLVDYDTRNFKALGSVYIRTNPDLEEQSPELILGANYGAGTTVYQGDNRFSLKNITFIQPRVEFRKRDDYFIRAYMSREDAGDSYDPYFTALRLQERSQTFASLVNRYRKWWVDNGIAEQMIEMGYPEVDIIFDPNTGTVQVNFDSDAAQQWLADNQGFLNDAHNQARLFVNTPIPAEDITGRLEPGTAEYEAAFNEITSTFNNEDGGTRFFDKSALYHVHGEKKFNTDFANITAGANYRLYRPETRGTVFLDTLVSGSGESAVYNRVSNSEYGLYVGLDKEIQDGKWRFSATLRTDKNINFDRVWTPAASVVWKPRANHFLRVSFASGVRNPTLSDQYLNLNVGPAILAGNLNGVEGLYTLESFNDYRNNLLQRSFLRQFDIAPIQPEKVKTGEIGYRATLLDNLYVDASYYYSVYDDFIGFRIGLDLEFENDESFIPENIQAFRYSANAQESVTTQGFSIGLNYYFANYFQLNGNYSFNQLITETDDPIVPAYNTPEHKFNIGISGRDVYIAGNDNFGFNLNYKWIEGFLFEGSPQFTGFIPSYGLLNGQVNYKFERVNGTLKVGATNILNNKVFQTYGGPRIGRLAYVSFLYEWDK